MTKVSCFDIYRSGGVLDCDSHGGCAKLGMRDPTLLSSTKSIGGSAFAAIMQGTMACYGHALRVVIFVEDSIAKLQG